MATTDVVWDPVKARSNQLKHGVDFADAAVELEDQNALTIEDFDHYEQHFKTLAMSSHVNVLLIVHAEQDQDTIRIISTRRARKAQEQTHFEGDFHE